MCFGSKEKGGEELTTRPAKNSPSVSDKKSSYTSTPAQYVTPSGPPPQQSNHYTPPSGPPLQQRNQYDPPSGPPPSKASNQYAPPPGPPPAQQSQQYAPPSGPPPQGYAAPPAGPPPSQDTKPKPQHDWETAVPDTALLPPPPDFFNSFDHSPTTNASADSCERAKQWCARWPLAAPMTLDTQAIEMIRTSNIQYRQPEGFAGKLRMMGLGKWGIETNKDSSDACVIGDPPLYSVRQHSPLRTGRTHTIYYEVRLTKVKSKSGTIAIGFTALPYPNFRLPGWNRGSMAVHSDDGHKFVGDEWGGASLTERFKEGDTYGIGMTFENVDGQISVTCFFTRSKTIVDAKLGKVTDHEEPVITTWDLHEEHDAGVVLPVTGLEGFHDLSCAVGTFQGVECEVVFDPKQWAHHPEGIGG